MKLIRFITFLFFVLLASCKGGGGGEKSASLIDSGIRSDSGLQINNSATYTNSTSVILSLSSIGAKEMYVTNSEGCKSGGSYEPYSSTKSWTIDQTNSMASVYAKFKDTSGNESACISDTIIHDNTAPSLPLLTINNDSSATKDINITLGLNAIDADEMYITNTAGCSGGGIWENYNTSRLWSLTSLNSLNTIYVKYRDLAGNQTDCVSYTILHDNVAPTNTSISINSNNSFTNTVTVNLSLSATDASQMYITNTPGCSAGGIWESYSIAKVWTLAQTNTTAAVYAKFKDDAGNESDCISDSIIHSSLAPTGVSISINGNNSYTNSTSVSLSLTSTGATYMYITNTPGCSSGGNWVWFSATKSWILAQTNSIATVYAKYRDGAGNESECVSGTINHDDIAPSAISLQINKGVSHSLSKNVNLSLSANSATKMYITNDSGCASGGSWETYATTKSWAISPISNSATVYAKFKDDAGNESSCTSDSISYLLISPFFIPHDFVGFNSLPSNWVNSSWIDGNNWLIATDGGLSISQDGGSSYSNITTKNGLGSNRVNKVKNFGGTIYAATVGGLSYSNNNGNSFNNLSTYKGLGSNMIYDVEIVGDKIFAATSAGLSTSNNGGVSFTNLFQSNTIYEIDHQGSVVVVGSYNGVYVSLDGGNNFSLKTTANGLGSNLVKSVDINSDGQICAGTSKGIFISSDNGSTFSEKVVSGTSNPYVYEIKCSGSNIYAATNQGFFISTNQGSSFTLYSSLQGLQASIINDIFLDTNGKVYLSHTSGIAITADNGQSFSNIKSSNGLASSYVNKTYVSKGNYLYVSTSKGNSYIDANLVGGFLPGLSGKYVSQGDSTLPVWSISSATKIYKNSSVLKTSGIVGKVGGIFVTSSDDIYVNTSSGLAYSAAGNEVAGSRNFSNLTTSNGLGSNSVNKIYITLDKNVFAATEAGLSISSSGSTFINKTTTNGLGSNIVKSVFVDETTGAIYAGTSGGLSISTNGGTSFSNKNANQGINDLNINDILVDSSGRIILATNSGLFISFDGGASFSNFNKSLGLPGNTVLSLSQINGVIFVGTSTGLCSISF